MEMQKKYKAPARETIDPAEKKSHEEIKGPEGKATREMRVNRLRNALRGIGGCCNDTDCLGAI